MSENSKIEWTDHTVNWWWGCVVATLADGSLSEACRNCYAETFAKRTGRAKWGPRQPRWFPNLDRLASNLRKWNKRAAEAGVVERVFCNSMSDFFELHQVPEEAAKLDEARAHAFALMAECTHLRFLVLTKRPENVLDMVPFGWVGGCEECGHRATSWHPCSSCDSELLPSHWPSNVWIGTTVEDQQSADERIPHLLKVPAPVRFLSCEPLLGPVDLSERLQGHEGWPHGRGVQWVIAGGESGHGARPMHPDWVRSLRDQCAAAGVPFHFKQWGAWAPWHEDGRLGNIVGKRAGFFTHTDVWHENGINTFRQSMVCIGKKAAGRLLDGETWDGRPDA